MSSRDEKQDGVDPGAMMDGMRSQLESDEAGGKLADLTVERLEKAVSHPKAKEVITQLMGREGESVEAGAPAPDFTLPWLPGYANGQSEAMTLSQHFGERPVALIFGSYT